MCGHFYRYYTHMLSRSIGEKIKQSKKSILLLGPRQTGKSTLLRSLKPDLILNLANESEYLAHTSDPSLFLSLLENSKIKSVMVDEIQRIPSLLNSIQAYLDEHPGKQAIKFFLSCSSARKLRRGQANLLPGRIFSYQLGGLTAKELNYQLDLKKSLRFGVLPEPYFEESEEFCRKHLSTYAATYLREEIQAEALTRNIQGFSRFLNAVALVSGSVLDFSKVSTKAKVSRSSVIRFVEILEDTLIAERVPSFEDAESADVIKHPKLYFFDVGVLNGLLGNFESSPDRMGALFEQFIFNQLRNSAQALDLPLKVFFFRTRHGVEVDFILEHQNKIWAIEIKSGQVSDADLKGLQAFRSYYPKVHQCMAVGIGEQRRFKDNILICDWVTMLKELGL